MEAPPGRHVSFLLKKEMLIGGIEPSTFGTSRATTAETTAVWPRGLFSYGEQIYFDPPSSETPGNGNSTRLNFHSRSSTTTTAKPWNTRLAGVPPPSPHQGGLGLSGKCLISLSTLLTR
jgi:hypothetical protein